VSQTIYSLFQSQVIQHVTPLYITALILTGTVHCRVVVSMCYSTKLTNVMSETLLFNIMLREQADKHTNKYTHKHL